MLRVSSKEWKALIIVTFLRRVLLTNKYCTSFASQEFEGREVRRRLTLIASDHSQLSSQSVVATKKVTNEK